MSAVPTNVGVFFGRVDKRAEGWYWAGAQSEKLRGAIRGPFETKKLAVEVRFGASGKVDQGILLNLGNLASTI
jgi:hypothetical protein